MKKAHWLFQMVEPILAQLILLLQRIQTGAWKQWNGLLVVLLFLGRDQKLKAGLWALFQFSLSLAWKKGIQYLLWLAKNLRMLVLQIWSYFCLVKQDRPHYDLCMLVSLVFFFFHFVWTSMLKPWFHNRMNKEKNK